MAMAIPQWLLGKHYTSVTFIGQVVSAAGVPSNSTVAAASVTVTRYKEGLDLQVNPIKEDINDDASYWANNVVLADDWTATFNAIAVNDGGDPDKLFFLITNFDIIKMQFTYGTGASARTKSLIGSRGAYSHNAAGRGATKISLELNCVDTGTGVDASIQRS